MAKGYRRDSNRSYGGRTIRVHVKGTNKHKSYTATRPDLGRPGIGPKLIPIIHKGSLTKYDYAIKKSAEARRDALKKAIKAYGPLEVFHKLQAQANLRKRTQPKARAVFQSDAQWVSSNYLG